MFNLDGVRMHVSSTASNGVVDSDTVLTFSQRGEGVFAQYCGGQVRRGWLVGRLAGDELRFRYAQREGDAAIHGGASRCTVERRPNGRLRIIENFAWSTRSSTGVNVFDELPR